MAIRISDAWCSSCTSRHDVIMSDDNVISPCPPKVQHGIADFLSDIVMPLMIGGGFVGYVAWGIYTW